jgi:hypothetical protein
LIKNFNRKKSRLSYDQNKILEDWFIENDGCFRLNTSTETKLMLAKKTDLKIQRVEDWIYNRRKKDKKTQKRRFSRNAQEILIQHKYINHKCSKHIIENISKLTGETKKKIRKWFYNVKIRTKNKQKI